MFTRLKQHLKTKLGEPLELVRRNGELGVDIDGREFQSLDVRPGEEVIHFFGGSSLVMPQKSTAFPAQAERLLNKSPGRRFRAVNLGHPGLDSYSVRNRVLGALSQRPPGLVVIYSGHNDFTSAYWDYVLPYFYVIHESPVLDPLAHGVYSLILAPIQRLRNPNNQWTYHSFWVVELEPRINRLLQRVGAIQMPAGLFRRVNALALEHYQANISSILEATESRGIPVVLMTVISSLETRPVGIRGEAETWYHRGQQQRDYATRVNHLTRARDLDLMSGMVRARSSLNAYIRSLRGRKGVHVLDLEQALKQRQERFGDITFVDALHLSDSGHKKIGAIVAQFIRQQKVCCSL